MRQVKLTDVEIALMLEGLSAIASRHNVTLQHAEQFPGIYRTEPAATRVVDARNELGIIQELERKLTSSEHGAKRTPKRRRGGGWYVVPRYTPGSPALVDYAIAKKVAVEEMQSYHNALRGVYGQGEQYKALDMGLQGIVQDGNRVSDLLAEALEDAVGQERAEQYRERIAQAEEAAWAQRRGAGATS
jgi:hypothetical protein